MSLGSNALGGGADCLIDPDNCAEHAVSAGGVGALGCVPWGVGSVLSLGVTCLGTLGGRVDDLLECCEGSASIPACVGFGGGGGGAGVAQAGAYPFLSSIGLTNFIDDQLDLVQDAGDVIEALLGSPAWAEVPIEDQSLADAILDAVLEAVDPEGPGGTDVSSEERTAVLALARPANIGEADVAALVDRYDRVFNETGMLEAGERKEFLGELEDYVAAAERLDDGGWSTVYDAIHRGIPELSALLDDTLKSSSAVASGNALFQVTDTETGQVQRGQLGAGGTFTGLRLAAETRYVAEYVDPVSLDVGRTVFTTPPSGEQFRIPMTRFVPPLTPDTDGDGLADGAEPVVGTDPADDDTDGDGILDGAEVEQELDPLEGVAGRTGILASADTPGRTVDVCAGNGVVVVANGDAGITVFNVFAGMEPVAIAQVDTPGNASRVDCAGRQVVVADGSEGVAIIDASDPPAAAVVGQVPPVALGADTVHTVAAAGSLAYAALANGRIALVDLTSGEVLERRYVAQSLRDLGVSGDRLYVLSDEGLYVLALEGDRLQTVGFGRLPAQPGGLSGGLGPRLFVGLDTAYATIGIGFFTFDIRDSKDPRAIGGGGMDQLGWKHMVANGRGRAVAAMAPNSTFDGPHHVSLYDVSDPAQPGTFLAEFPTPGIATAVAIHDGQAYVAGGKAGLQVVNYLPYDTEGEPPSIALEASFPLDGASVEEVKRLRLTARVADDVQVRSVEFYRDGELAVRDGSFPFEYRLTAPLAAETSAITLRARAVDTGGNDASTEPLEIEVVEDLTPPQVTSFAPEVREIGPRSVAVFFDEPVDPASLVDAISVLSAGPDGEAGTGDDVPVDGGRLDYREEVPAALLRYESPLPVGLYRAAVSSALTDRAGNALAEEVAWTFWSAEPTVVEGRVELPGGGPAAGADVVVTDAEGRVLARTTATADGSFSVRIPASGPGALSVRVAVTVGGERLAGTAGVVDPPRGGILETETIDLIAPSDEVFGQRQYDTPVLPRSVAMGDFDADGALDLAVADDEVVLLRNLEGGFPEVETLDAFDGRGRVRLRAGDLDRDGALDLAAVHTRDEELVPLLGDGTGSFARGTATAIPGAQELGLADMDGDDDLDAVVAVERGLVVARNDGTGVFDDLPPLGDGVIGSNLHPVHLGDLDLDGALDLVYTGRKRLFAMYGDGQGGLSAADFLEGSPFREPRGLATGDFDADGDPDIASSGVEVALNEGGREFSDWAAFPHGGSTAQVVAADFDGDGALDLAASRENAGNLAFYSGAGDGTFEDPTLHGLGEEAASLQAVDLDGDGDLDLAASLADEGRLVILENRKVR